MLQKKLRILTTPTIIITVQIKKITHSCNVRAQHIVRLLIFRKLTFRLPTNSVHRNGNIREQPKVIVFLNQLLQHFTHCHLCFAKQNPHYHKANWHYFRYMHLYSMQPTVYLEWSTHYLWQLRRWQCSSHLRNAMYWLIYP